MTNQACSRGGTWSENRWGCATGHWKLETKRSRQKWNLGQKDLILGGLVPQKIILVLVDEKKYTKKIVFNSLKVKKGGQNGSTFCIGQHRGNTRPWNMCLVFSSGQKVTQWLKPSTVGCHYNVVQYNIAISLNTAVACRLHKSEFVLTKDTLYPTLTGEIWGVHYEDFQEIWPYYSGTTLCDVFVTLAWLLTQNISMA